MAKRGGFPGGMPGNMNNLMNNKINISKLIVKNNYYKYLKDNGLFKNN